MTNGAPDNWSEYRRLILDTLQRQSGDIDGIRTKLDSFMREIAVKVARMEERVASQARTQGFWAGVVASVVVSLVAQILARAFLQ